jgi:hypothetical protein
LRDTSPLELLLQASAYVEMATPRVLDHHDEDFERLPLEVLAAAGRSGVRELEALAAAAAVIHPDPSALADAGLDGARVAPQRPPVWMASMADIAITRVLRWEWDDGEGRFGESLAIEWRWVGGATAFVFVGVELTHGASLEEMGASDVPLARLFELHEAKGGEPIVAHDLDPASARARIEQLVQMSEYRTAEIHTERWPHGRPFLEWVLRHLPEGGEGYDRVCWPGFRMAFLVDAFMASPFVEGFALGIDEAIDLMELVTEFRYEACDGDPLHWTVDQVETLLLEWFPPHIEGVEAYIMFDLPDVLASFVRYTGRLISAEPGDTDQLVQAVERCRRPYLEAVLARLDPLDDAEEFDTFLDLIAEAQDQRWG